MRKLRGLLSFLVAAMMVLGCASSAFAWAPEWEHDEDLSGYKLCDNFGDIKLTIAVTDHSSIEDWETNAYVKWLEEVTNVDLSFELIPFEKSRGEALAHPLLRRISRHLPFRGHDRRHGQQVWRG